MTGRPDGFAALGRFGRWSRDHWIIRIHRWLGASLSLLFLIWFLSGFVMMYAGFPEVGWMERVDRGEPLPTDGEALLSPGEASRMAGVASGMAGVAAGTADVAPGMAGVAAAPDSLHLISVLGRPIWVFKLPDGGRRAVDAEDGTPFRVDDPATAIRLARSFEGSTGGESGSDRAARVETLNRLDQWTPRSFYLPHMPLHRVHLGDPGDTRIYVSSTTGAVVQRHDRRERILGWLGPIPHWIYPRELIVRRPVWRQVVIWSSLLGVVTCLAGLTIGTVRWLQARRNPRGPSRFTPYRERWYRWHHVVGFVFGAFALTWVFSGLLSMTPLDWSPPTTLTRTETLAWQGGGLDPDRFEIAPEAALAAASRATGRPIRLLRAVQLGGNPYWIAHMSWAETVIVPGSLPPRGEGAEGSQSDAASIPVHDAFPDSVLLAGVERIHPDRNVTATERVEEPDAYYYPRYQPLRFPVLRADVDDRERTRLYLDPATGSVALRYDRRSRLNRWIYHGLHSFDVPGLEGNRPLWDVLVLLLLSGGTALSATGVILGWRWAARTVR